MPEIDKITLDIIENALRSTRDENLPAAALRFHAEQD